MAKATASKSEITEVVLTLTREEAEAVAWVFGGISGSNDSPRGITSRIWSALKKAGVGYGDLSDKWDRLPHSFPKKPTAEAEKKGPKCRIPGCDKDICNPDSSYKNYRTTTNDLYTSVNYI